MAVAREKLALREPRRASRLALLWSSAIGKKALMSVSGVVLFLYVIGHMLGNLQVFAGQERIDGYAHMLHAAAALLWIVRVILLAALLVHVVAGVQLNLAARAARSVEYADYRPGVSSPASRTMIWSGLLILAFVVYHLLDLTVGVANPDFREGEVFHNILATFGQVIGVLAYLLAMVGLGFHLWHGVYAMFQTLGMTNRRLTPSVQKLAAGAAVVITLGFSSIPLAVLVGIIAPR